MVNPGVLIASGSLKSLGLGSLGKSSGIGGLGGGSLGKLSVLLFLARFGIHGIWGVGSFFLTIFIVLIGIFYLIYRYRMGQI